MEKDNHCQTNVVLGIDASRNRSGGAKAHLIGILTESDPRKYGIHAIHVWSYRNLLTDIPDRPWLVKHNPPALEKSILHQLIWQYFLFPGEFAKAGCSIVLNTCASTVSTFQPCVTMSRDMLSYEPGEIERYGLLSKARLRLLLLRYMQNRALRMADGAVFLTQYAAKVIQEHCGLLSQIAYIPHGVGVNFKNTQSLQNWPLPEERPIRCLYISNAAMHKHQWQVVRAIETLRKRGHNITLTLVGGGNGKAQRLLAKQLALSDPQGIFTQQLEFIPQYELPRYLEKADVFVFASSCENMPNTLIEAMSVGLPIACSHRGPMPEVLVDGGVYFDPEDFFSIVYAIEKLITDPFLRSKISKRAKELSNQYSWLRCANETWKFITDTFNKYYEHNLLNKPRKSS